MMNGSTHLGVLSLASCALISCGLMWRRQRQLQAENELLREALKRRQASKIKANKEPQHLGPVEKEDGASRLTLESQGVFEKGLLVKPVGIVRSIYRLCVGTPRQGLLVPNARGSIELLQLGDSSASSSTIGLEEYSHIWVLFVFHLNTQAKKATRIKSKIAPPALGGKKVGVFATRTPHRFNPIGITLCKLDRVEVKKQNVKLHVSGLDLVDGTPVLDIKPFVPVYDAVPEQDSRLPEWVSGGLSMKRTVVITKTARVELESLLTDDPNCLAFYGPKFGEKTPKHTLEYCLDCIRQVLAIDVRSSYQTKKSRSGKFQAERSGRLEAASQKNDEGSVIDQVGAPNEPLCTQQLDNLLVTYKVDKADSHQRVPSENSGAEDVLSVVSIRLINVPNKRRSN